MAIRYATLSCFGKTNDKFWFTFFHEAAYLLLHAKGGDAKKSIFLDEPNTGSSTNIQEQEANTWAANFLIPQERQKELKNLKSEAAVLNFAQQVQIHPGILVGRLHYEGILSFKQLNGLKVSYRWQ